jgi:hypothetical protein
MEEINPAVKLMLAAGFRLRDSSLCVEAKGLKMIK